MARAFAYVLQALGARLALALFGALPLEAASDLGGWLGRGIGPLLPVSRRARRNLARAFPEKSGDEIVTIVRGMWDNLGRVAAEYAHLGEIDVYDPEGRVEMVGAETIELLRDDGRGGIFFAAHLGNWEITPLAASQNGLALTHIYRAANNPHIEPLLRKVRAPLGGVHYPKGVVGAKKLVEALRRGEHLAIVADQKQNDGIAVPFFGRDAMTAPALAQLALKFDCPLVPTRVERLGGARFRLTIYPPMALPASGDREADVRETMRRVNALFEDWIRERPEQWLWLHRRWPDDD